MRGVCLVIWCLAMDDVAEMNVVLTSAGMLRVAPSFPYARSGQSLRLMEGTNDSTCWRASEVEDW
jgi:hypothetical protein